MILDPTDQRIRDAGFNYVPFDRFLASPFQIPQGQITTDANTGAAGIATLPMSGGGRGGALQAGDPMTNFDNFYDYTSNKYFSNMPTPLIDALPESMRAKTFMGFPSYREQELTGPDMGEYIASGTDIPLELTTAGKIQQGLGSAKEGLAGLAEKFKGIGPISMILGSMDRFDTLPKLDQEFIKANMGYTGPTVFGENTTGLSKDPFGVNVRSAFGNYAEKVRSDYAKLSENLGKGRGGATFNPETGMFESDELSAEQLARINKQTNMLRNKFLFRQKQIEQQKINEKIAENNRKVAEAQARSQAAADNQRMQRQSDGGGGGNLTRSREQGGLGLSASQAQAVSAANAAAGMGGYGLADGGIVDMLEIYD